MTDSRLQIVNRFSSDMSAFYSKDKVILIQMLLEQGVSQAQIARRLGKDPSEITHFMNRWTQRKNEETK